MSVSTAIYLKKKKLYNLQSKLDGDIIVITLITLLLFIDIILHKK